MGQSKRGGEKVEEQPKETIVELTRTSKRKGFIMKLWIKKSQKTIDTTFNRFRVRNCY